VSKRELAGMLRDGLGCLPELCEAGGDEVALRQPTTLVPWPVLLKTHHVSVQETGEAEADRRIALIKQLEVEIL